MYWLSRWFRKAPPRSPQPETPPPAVPKTSAAERALAASAEEQALQSALAARDASALAQLVVSGRSTQARQAAAGAIEDPEQIRQLIREVRGGNDKNVYKILTGKRDALAEQERRRERERAEALAVAQDLERHSQRAYDVVFAPRLEEVESRWSAVAAQADAALRDQAVHWLARARQTIAEHEREQAERRVREQAQAAAAEAARQLREQQAQAAAQAASEQALILDEQQRERAQQQASEQQAQRQIMEAIRKARAALAAGSTGRAAALRASLDPLCAGLAAVPPHLASQIQQLDKQLDALKDWKQFSVMPKRAELIEEMEALIASELDPPTLAEQIKRLQEQWRLLGKGAGPVSDAALEADAQRFHDAADKAYQPCREYFAAQARIREENLRQREGVLVQLTAFEAGQDWERADWRAVTKQLQESRQEWRRHVPVDRQAAKAQEQAFQALVAGLQQRLEAEYGRNQQQKAALIEDARQLLGLEDGRKAIDAVKALQQRWQAVGLVPREIDQRLWKDFREHCDAVFQKRRDASAAHAAGLEGNKSRAVELCEQIEAIAALEGAELRARVQPEAQVRRAFEALGELPRAEARDLRQRLERGLDRIGTALAREQAREAERGWDALFKAADQVRAYRLALTRGADAAELEAKRESAEAGLAADPQWPKPARAVLQQALADEGAQDLRVNADALRRLCIRAECVADRSTPDEDQALRRDYQLQRLAQNMGQGSRAEQATWSELAIEWLRVGPVDDAVYACLVPRFRACRVADAARAA